MVTLASATESIGNGESVNNIESEPVSLLFTLLSQPKYKIGISRNTKITDNVNSVFELVINGLDLKSVQRAVAEGITSAVSIPGVVKITAANYGGKLGRYKAVLKESLNL